MHNHKYVVYVLLKVANIHVSNGQNIQSIFKLLLKCIFRSWTQENIRFSLKCKVRIAQYFWRWLRIWFMLAM